MAKQNNFYDIPNEFYHRIHFVRPRFKNNIENVLLYMATECCKIPTCSNEEYNAQYTKAIRMFPGNMTAAAKTIANWRTETPALFAFYEEDKTIGITKTSKMAKVLSEEQDLTQFFKFFLFSFQFPVVQLKARDNIDLIINRIRFKPAKLILQVLIEGNKLLFQKGSAKDMSISAEEATYCIFNDIRCTTGAKTPKAIAETILYNRLNKIKYYNTKDRKIFDSKGKPRTKGDVTRYAGDILDYMEIASLLEKSHGYFRINGLDGDAIDAFVKDETFFKAYDKFYLREIINPQEISAIEPDWFAYVNNAINPNAFKTDISTLLVENELEVIVDDRIREMLSSEDTTTKDVGNIGESLICGHERMRLKLNGFEELISKVRIVDSPAYHPGFDIESFEGDGSSHHRFIEVKTTISKRRIQLYNFHMSDHEWNIAGSIGEHYCVYRLMLSAEDKTLYILRNPVNLYKTDSIEVASCNGMDISFDASKFETTPLLIWQS